MAHGSREMPLEAVLFVISAQLVHDSLFKRKIKVNRDILADILVVLIIQLKNRLLERKRTIIGH